MEVRCLPREENGRTRALYEEVFVEDEKAFVDAYYQIKAADNQILVLEDEGEIVSMLHRNPYTFWFRGKQVPADYIVAVATRREYRHGGLMRSLLTKALLDMEEEKKPFTFLMPADEAIYTPFGFRLMGNEDKVSSSEREGPLGGEEGLQELASEEPEGTYDLFVEKDAAYDRRHIDWPEWESTPMMIRLVYLPAFVAQIGAKDPQSLTIEIKDPILCSNNGTFRWEFDTEGSRLIPSEEEPEFWISIADLGSFLCGMLGTEELPGVSGMQDVRKKTKLLEKLKKIKVLDSIYINETV